MRVAYLINQYPKVSHSFIRREILALEAVGVEVSRFSIRKTPVDELFDPDDISEAGKTCALLNNNTVTLLWVAFCTFLAAPILFGKVSIEVIRCGRKGKRGVIRHLAYLVEACLLKRYLLKYNISHVHAHFGTNPAAVAMFCKMLGGPDYSFTVHGPEEFDDPEGLSLKEKVELSKFTVAISSYGRSQLMRQTGYEQWKKIKIIHCAVDNSFLMGSAGDLPTEKQLVCVGRLCEQKGQLLLVEALSILNNEGVSFRAVLAGDGTMRSEIERIITKYALQDKISITGWLTGEEVKNELLSSRVMVLPSFAEGLPVVIMESLALGRPVLSTYIAGIPELIEDRKNGWLVPAGDVDALAEMLREVLLTSDEELAKMGAYGRQKVKENHTDVTEAEKLKLLMADEDRMQD